MEGFIVGRRTKEGNGEKGRGDGGEVVFSEEEKKYLSILLEEKRVGLDKLVQVVKKDMRDVEIMKQECFAK